MRRVRRSDITEDLFATPQTAVAESSAVIRSPLVDETREMLFARAMTLGNLLASERAVEYVAVLRALTVFRLEHEPEPLHEDVAQRVCGDDADAFALSAFKSDIRQLKEWGLVTERIKKERLRGYRDNRRTKFRYRICEDAAAFVDWLSERRAHDLAPGASDETGNLLDLQRSLLSELRRMLHRVNPETVGYDAAGDYREFDDFPNVMRIIEHVRLGGGERARKLLSVTGEPLDVRKEIAIGESGLSFEDIRLRGL